MRTTGSLPRPLATAYLAVVAGVWLTHLVGVALWLITGRSAWTTDNPWVVLPGLVLAAAAVGIVWLVDRRLNTDRPRHTEALRMLGLAYGRAVPLAWSALRRGR